MTKAGSRPHQDPVPPEAASQPDFRTVQYLGSKFRLLGPIAEAMGTVAPDGARVCDLFTGSGVVARRLSRAHPVLACDIQEYSHVLTTALLEPCPMAAEDARLLVKEAAAEAERRRGGLAGLVALESAAIRSARVDPTPLADIVELGSIRASEEPDEPPPEPLASLLAEARSSIPRGPSTVMVRYYGGLYFSYQQALELDAIATVARRCSGTERTTVLAPLLSAASQVVSTVGSHFAQPVRPRSSAGRAKAHAVRAVARRREPSVLRVFEQWLERYRLLPAPPAPSTAWRVDYREALRRLPVDMRAVYADPPYTRDHYSRFYHVLETMALGDEPAVSRVRIRGEDLLSRGLYREGRHQSPFSVKSQVRGAFDELFAPLAERRIPLVLSYSPYAEHGNARPRLMTIDELVGQAASHFGDVDVRSPGRLAHSKLNAGHLNAALSYEAEILMICRP